MPFAPAPLPSKTQTAPTAAAMAKSKNHTAHNQSKKNHRNGIKKPMKHKYTSTKGVREPLLPPRARVSGRALIGGRRRRPHARRTPLLHPSAAEPPAHAIPFHPSPYSHAQMDPKFLRNQRHAKKHNASAKKVE